MCWGVISLTYLANACGFKNIPITQWNWLAIIGFVISGVINAILGAIVLSSIMLIRTKEESAQYNLPRIPIVSKNALKTNLTLLLINTSAIIYFGLNLSLHNHFAWYYLSIPPFIIMSIISLYVTLKKDKKGMNLLTEVCNGARLIDHWHRLDEVDTSILGNDTDAREITKKQFHMFKFVLLPAEDVSFSSCESGNKLMLSSSQAKETLSVKILLPNQPEADNIHEIIEIPCKHLTIEAKLLKKAMKKGSIELISLLNRTINEALWEMSYEKSHGNIHIDELINTIAAGDMYIVKWFMRKNININKEGTGGWTPVLMAAAEGKIEILSLLLQYGGNPNHQNFMKATALMHAAIHNDVEVMQLLLDYGADINLQDFKGNTALMNAISYGHSKAAIFLIEHGANPHLKNYQNLTALNFAEVRRMGEIAKKLRKKTFSNTNSRKNKSNRH